MNLIRIIFAGIFALLFSSLTAQENPLWMRYPTISPDGKTIAFCYKGDIFLVNSEGGRATQLTTHSAYDSRPIWSPDGKTIAFTSGRDGGMDLYTVSVIGGTPTRLTNFSGSAIPECYTPDGKSILYRSNILPDKAFCQFPSGGQVYKIPVTGGRPELFLTFEAYNIHFNKAGDKIFYHDRKGYEDEWRKHHTSSVCRDIWSYELPTGKFTNLTNKQVEDRYPVLASDDQTLYFLSERFGDFNVCKMSVDDPENIKQLTRFSKHPVRFLSRSKDDVLCFSYDGEIYTLKSGKQPKKVNISIIADNQEPAISKYTWGNGAREIAVAPNGKEFAVVVRGDIFVANAEYGTTRRITNTAAQERNVSFSPDGRSLVYASERNGQWNLYISRIKEKDDQSFAYAREVEEEQLTKGTNACFQPAFSPDGKEVAYLENRTEIKVMNLKNKKTRTVLPAKYNYSYADGDQSFEWSPDGRWILAQFFEEGGWQHPDVALVKADGKGEIHNLTNSGYSDGNPRWMMNGKAIIWSTDREGMRSHGSWGAQRDIYALFLDPQAYEEFRMSKEERALAKELKALKDKKEAEEKAAAEKKNKKGKEEKKADTKNKKDKGNKTEEKAGESKSNSKEKAGESKLPELKLDLKDPEDRMVRMTINSSNLGDAVLTNDGSKLYYLAAFEKGYDLWVHDFENKSTRILSKMGRGGALELSKDGKTLYLLSGGQIFTINQGNGQLKSLGYKAEFELKRAEERQGLFNHVWQQVNDKFYDKDFKGVDWPFYKKAYERFLPHINNEYDFADVLGEMLGELNASHTGARYGGQFSRPATAALGAFYDSAYEGDGLKISEILERGPLDRSDIQIKSGMIIRKIDNQEIKKDQDYFPLLEGKAGKRVLLTVYNPEKKKEFEEYVKPIPASAQGQLLYMRWVKRCQQMVDSLSKGQIGYIHVASMNSPSFRKTYSDLLGRYRNRKAIIIDTRYNGGGWLHEDLIHLLSGKQFATFVPRGQFIGIDPFAQWTKPSTVLISESNYSNAHGFPWAYKELGIGKLVGMPVPGTMTAVWWETLMNGIVFGIPQVAMKDNQGRVLENLQLEPDIKVNNDPASAMQGRDLQIEAAVESLMKEIK